MVKVTMVGTIHEKTGSVEYKMPHAMAKEILNTRKGTDKNMPPKEFLVKYVNEELGLLHKCVRVITF